MSEECGVMVGVRIRPFNQRENDLSAQLCVQVDGATTILNPPPEETDDPKKKEVRRFTFDASFWSHDGFVEEPNGYFRAAEGSHYADQQHVFNTFGTAVLDNAWAGYHCCLFAYGQTGAGKSYSMVGYGANRGIVPISCEEIFRRIESNTDPGLKYEVLVSMVEIYNEQVQDLLIAARLRPKKGLEIRESKQVGIYIDGVSKRAVASYKAIEAVVDEGTNNRSLGSTLMNATSSRAHTVLVIEFKQLSVAAGQTGCKVSLINLVDLAGSEKAGQTGASGDRLKEGCAINKSLSALGNVIEKLADKAEKKGGKAVVIPYRDSKLTRLLQNALGGSSKTIMICAISPASSNHEETLSTLRYADRAKRIKNAAVVNENPADKLIRQLREENAKLREMVVDASPTAASQGADAQTVAEMEQKKAEIISLEQALQEMQRSFADRLEEAKVQAARDAQARKAADLSLPHITNLNEDQLLTNKLRFAFKEGRTRIGRSAGDNAEEEPEVCLAGPGIQQVHAAVENARGTCMLSVSQQAAANTFVNGQNPSAESEGVQLAHGDRVAFGQCMFIFIDPSLGTAEQLLSSGKVSYAAARKEVAQGGAEGEELEELKASRQRAEELERQVREAEAAKAAAKADADALLRQREEEFRQRMENLQKEFESKEQEAKAAVQANDHAQARTTGQDQYSESLAEQANLHARHLEKMQRDFEERQRKVEEAARQQIKNLEKKAQKAAAEEEDHRQREHNMRRLEEQLMVAMPLVKEANLIAVELGKPHRFETQMHVELSGTRSRGSIHVTAIVSRDSVRVYEWQLETLENRIFLMRELLQRCEEEGFGVLPGLGNHDDPFWDPIQVERQIGVAQASLQGLLMQVENSHDCRLLSTEVSSEKDKAHQVGHLRVEIWPCSNDGTPSIPDEELVQEAEEMLGTRMAVLVRVVRAKGLPEELANDVRVEYDFFIDEAPHQVPPLHGHNREPEFNYGHIFVQDPVTSHFLEYCEKKSLVFRVYGTDAQALRLHREAAVHGQPAPGNMSAHEHYGLGASGSTHQATTPGMSDRAPAASAASAPGGASLEVTRQPPPEDDMPPLPGELPLLGGDTAVPSQGVHATASQPLRSPGTQLLRTADAASTPSVSRIRREAERTLADSDSPYGFDRPKSKACVLL
mmetsp:Transcript_86459/g.241963  ORF Transcript_86459/g.241963 Transcript_86459/m.241963 type:complete len:1156 (+) Transcript_86459:114-3581(+)